MKHSIAGGDYGLRRREVEAGQIVLQEQFPEAPDLGHADMEKLAACEAFIPPESFRRCRHIISENNRVRDAKAAILAGNPERFGNLMTLSHISQRDDFACSCEEIDFLVDRALRLPGCYGARLTGGGFGGCTVNLVSSERAENFADSLQHAYREQFQLDAPVYVCEAVAGAFRQEENLASVRRA